MHDFRKALADNPAPARLGDVSLRYAPSMLIGETAAPGRTWRPTGLVTLGGALLVVSVALLGVSSELVALPFLLGSAAAFGGSAWLLRHERRKRGFVVNYATLTLRLDFVTPFAGRPRTLLVPFDDVKALALLEQADGRRCLTVDFALDGGLFREVLVASIAPQDVGQAQRLERVLSGAFAPRAGGSSAVGTSAEGA